MPFLVLGLFALALVLAIVLDVSLLWALGFGHVLFFANARSRGVASKRLFRASLEGIRAVSPILVVFVLIGMLTAAWRASGTIAYLVALALSHVEPALYLPSAFVLNAALSFLLGSSFATAATLGVITMSLGNALGIMPALSAGAILAGIYFGDRCSPMSTSAHPVATVTGTQVHANIPRMWQSALPALVLSLCIYAGASLVVPSGSAESSASFDAAALFAREFDLSWPLALPALLVLALSLARINVRVVMLASILAALAFCLAGEGRQALAPADLPNLLLFGFEARDARVAALMNGGGILSFAVVGGIVCLSSSYAGLFREGRLPDSFSPLVLALSKRFGNFAPYLAISTLLSALACNQTLPIMLTSQLTQTLPVSKEARAVNVEDSAVVIPALLPWSIACAMPLRMLEAPNLSVLFAVYLWLIPLSRLFFTPKVLQPRGGGK